jgi:hypothetical protein
MFGVLGFAIAYYEGNPSPDEKPLAAFARALGYADQSQLESAMDYYARDLSDKLARLFNPNQSSPLAKDRVHAKFGTMNPSRDLSNRLYSAEEKVWNRFGIETPSLEYSDAKKFSEALNRMEAGLPLSYRDQLKMVLRRVDNLAWMRIYYSDNPGPYLRCFA